MGNRVSRPAQRRHRGTPDSLLVQWPRDRRSTSQPRVESVDPGRVRTARRIDRKDGTGARHCSPGPARGQRDHPGQGGQGVRCRAAASCLLLRQPTGTRLWGLLHASQAVGVERLQAGQPHAGQHTADCGYAAADHSGDTSHRHAGTAKLLDAPGHPAIHRAARLQGSRAAVQQTCGTLLLEAIAPLARNTPVSAGASQEMREPVPPPPGSTPRPCPQARL
ncbi:MAG: hypothetical protein AVDCRST_MAG51-3528 [uncultured Ramlibacter sp.]|uniref:Uncharacterized protein n=1 Tax=uncultured Ramlibacter sp. TaxID=260755 RepID=A0A6J4QRI7_9BURK|nr:MAG: hypothetical protein AVDCRST_MAG51-3528 [uncultured Ramlibacter sp.]